MSIRVALLPSCSPSLAASIFPLSFLDSSSSSSDAFANTECEVYGSSMRPTLRNIGVEFHLTKLPRNADNKNCDFTDIEADPSVFVFNDNSCRYWVGDDRVWDRRQLRCVSPSPSRVPISRCAIAHMRLVQSLLLAISVGMFIYTARVEILAADFGRSGEVGGKESVSFWEACAWVLGRALCCGIRDNLRRLRRYLPQSQAGDDSVG